MDMAKISRALQLIAPRIKEEGLSIFEVDKVREWVSEYGIVLHHDEEVHFIKECRVLMGGMSADSEMFDLIEMPINDRENGWKTLIEITQFCDEHGIFYAEPIQMEICDGIIELKVEKGHGQTLKGWYLPGVEVFRRDDDEIEPTYTEVHLDALREQERLKDEPAKYMERIREVMGRLEQTYEQNPQEAMWVIEQFKDVRIVLDSDNVLTISAKFAHESEPMEIVSRQFPPVSKDNKLKNACEVMGVDANERDTEQRFAGSKNNLQGIILRMRAMDSKKLRALNLGAGRDRIKEGGLIA
jgi:hypothetical protein